MIKNSALKIVLISLVLLVYKSGLSQNDSTFRKGISLDQALKIGLTNSYSVRISEAQTKISEINNSWAKAGGYPVVTANISNNNRYDNQPETQNPNNRTYTVNNSLTPGLNLRWNLFNGFAVSITKDNLETSLKISQTQTRSALENSATEIITAYNLALLEKEKLMVTKELMRLSKDKLDYYEIKKELGTALTYDVLQVKNSFLSDSANFLYQKMIYKNAARRLSGAMGDTSVFLYSPNGDFIINETKYDLDILRSQMLQDNSLLKSAKLNRNISENNIALAKSSYLPSLTLNTGTDFSNIRIKYPDYNPATVYTYDAYAGLTLSYIVFNGGNRERNVLTARINEDISKMRIEDLELNLKTNLYALYEMNNVHLELLHAAEENMLTTKLNLTISEDKYKAGIINSFNYRDVQIIYMNAAYSLLQAKYNLILTQTDIQKITGQIIK